jgi:glycosyltransferase involved in cell wall biosynthesis
MSKPLFSIVGISRNESKTLPRLLKSLEEFKACGGEVVIVDTGSTDNTVQIARDWGCKVFEEGDRFTKIITKQEAKDINDKFLIEGEEQVLVEGDKIFNFSEARNFVASKAENDMVSFADCDEEFTRLDVDAINAEISAGIQQFEYHFVFSHDSFGNPAIHFTQSKFYDRRLVKWTNAVHEVLWGQATRKYLPQFVFNLEHWQNLETNRSGYLRGLAYDCFQNLENDRNSHYFAREMMWCGRLNSAIKEFDRHIAMNRWPAEKAQSMIYKGDCLERLGRHEEAVRCWQEAFEVEPHRRAPLMALAWNAFHRGDKIKTACYAAAALEIPRDDFYANHNGHYSNEPHELLYWAKWWLGDKEGSKYHFDKAFAYQPYNKKYLADTQFYYEYPDSLIEGWMTFEELQFLYNTAKKMKTVAELGSFMGKSTHALLSAGARVTAIDHFKGSKQEGDATHGRDGIYEAFMKNVGHFPNLTVKRMSGDEAAKSDEMYDLVFIDAGHTFEEVVSDIKNWAPKAKKILCGHDYCDAWPQTMKAVNLMFGKPDEVIGSIWVKYIEKSPKISFLIPTLGRPEGLKRCLDSIEALDYPKESVEILVQEDEPRLGVTKRMKELYEKSTGEWLIFGSDDCEFTPDSIKNALKAAKEQNKGLVSFNTGAVLADNGNICEHFMIYRPFVKHYLGGEIFDCEMNHVGVDNLLWAKMGKLNQTMRCDEAIVNHYHFTKPGGNKFDETYAVAWKEESVKRDRELLAKKLAELDK